MISKIALKSFINSLLIATLVGCVAGGAMGWVMPWSTHGRTEDEGQKVQGDMALNITNISTNSMKLNVTQFNPKPTWLDYSPYFYTWDTVPHDYVHPSTDSFLSDNTHWFIQNSETDSSLTIDNSLLDRAVAAIDNANQPKFERLTMLGEWELKNIATGNEERNNDPNDPECAYPHIWAVKSKQQLIDFYNSQRLQPNTKYYVYVYRYSDDTYKTSYVYPIDNSGEVKTKP